MPTMQLARLMVGMRNIGDIYSVPYRVGSLPALDVRLAPHFYEKLTRIEAKALEFVLQPRFLIPEQLVITLPNSGH
jgi:hypothetical protein